MSLSELSIKRPIFITCVFLLTLVLGYMGLQKLPVDLFPDVTFPVVMTRTSYPGAGPKEIETLISKPIEDEVSSISGIKSLRSVNREGVSAVIAEFTLDTDIKYAEQQVRDRVAAARVKLPDDAEESVIRRMDPSDQPIVEISLSADLPPAEIYDLAHETIVPKIEQVPQVGVVEIYGGRKREIQVELDRRKLYDRNLSASLVRDRILASGKNVPAGKVDSSEKTKLYRTVAEFANVDEIKKVSLNFLNNEVAVPLSDVGIVKDTLEDEKTRSYVNGKPGLLLEVYKQSGANTVAVVDNLKKRIEDLNVLFKGKAELKMVQDMSVFIRLNVEDVKEAIFIGIFLTIVVVFFFLGSFRSTMITTLALPNSLLGAFILMSIAGFSINVMSLLALSLAVGLLIDDAIVVRENIFRHFEMGKPAAQAAKEGTSEVTLAVIATTFTVIAVFGPIGFLKGVVGQFFKQFGLTVCFAMLISLMDALTMAPMLSTYFAESQGSVLDAFSKFMKAKLFWWDPRKLTLKKAATYVGVVYFLAYVFGMFSGKPVVGLLAPLIIYVTVIAVTAFGFLLSLFLVLLNKLLGPFYSFINWTLKAFDRGQTNLENSYARTLDKYVTKYPFLIIGAALLIFKISLIAASHVPKTFLPAQDAGEFSVGLELPPDASLEATAKLSLEVDELMRKNPEIETAVLIAGDKDGASNKSSFYIRLVPRKFRNVNTSQMKDRLREQLKPYAYASPLVKDADKIGSGMRQFNLSIAGQDLVQLEQVATKVFSKLKDHPGLKDPEISHKPGKPETQIQVQMDKAQGLGVLSSAVGGELRALVEGVTPAVFRVEGREYNIRIRAVEEDRDLSKIFSDIRIPNLNGQLIPLPRIASMVKTESPTTINREDRIRYINIGADIAPNGPGMGGVIDDINKMLTVEDPLPQGVTYSFKGQANDFKELMVNMMIASGLGVLFIYLVLASLYESFITPLTIMLVLPLAICGAFFALFVTGKSLDLFSMIGCVMLMGLATKNSILLVDSAKQFLEQGKSMKEAIVEAGRVRLRPILMTSIALIMGMLPIAIGLNEASKQRVSMGIAIIGGLISSTLLSLYVVPASFSYMERFSLWVNSLFKKEPASFLSHEAKKEAGTLEFH